MTSRLDIRALLRAAVIVVFIVIGIGALLTLVHCDEVHAACTPLRICTAAITTNCASATPVIRHDASTNTNIAGHALYYRAIGGTFQKLVDWPCWWDLDDAGANTTRHCRAIDIGAPLQRYCPTCAPLNEYEFTVRAYDINGNYSLNSNILRECMPSLRAFN